MGFFLCHLCLVGVELGSKFTPELRRSFLGKLSRIIRRYIYRLIASILFSGCYNLFSLVYNSPILGKLAFSSFICFVGKNWK